MREQNILLLIKAVSFSANEGDVVTFDLTSKRIIEVMKSQDFEEERVAKTREILADLEEKALSKAIAINVELIQRPSQLIENFDSAKQRLVEYSKRLAKPVNDSITVDAFISHEKRALENSIDVYFDESLRVQNEPGKFQTELLKIKKCCSRLGTNPWQHLGINRVGRLQGIAERHGILRSTEDILGMVNYHPAIKSSGHAGPGVP